MSPVQVFDAARERCPELGLTTVYRTLELLSEIGALRRVHGPDHCEAFVPAGAAHGHTVVCSDCGRVMEFTECDMNAVVDAAARQTGYRITDALPAAQRPVRRLQRRHRQPRAEERRMTDRRTCEDPPHRSLSAAFCSPPGVAPSRRPRTRRAALRSTSSPP